MHYRTQYIFLWKKTFLFFFKILSLPFLLFFVATLFSYAERDFYDGFLSAGVIVFLIFLGAMFITVQAYSEMRRDRKITEKEERKIMGDSAYEECEERAIVEYPSFAFAWESRLFRWIFGEKKEEQEKEDDTSERSRNVHQHKK